MKVNVIGGGWYGCHIASTLLNEGHGVDLYESTGSLFSGASGANQSRLHLGFHYPRCAKTRAEAIAGYVQFMQTYPELTKEVPCNIYAVAEEVSFLDFQTYRDTMIASGLEFITLEQGDHGLDNIEGALLTAERLILQDHARDMFKKLLSGRVRKKKVKDIPKDTGAIFINCTYGGLPTPGVERYEPCVLFIYEGPTHYAVTVMDGPFGVSMYPYFQDGYVSLTSVEHTPIGKYKTMDEARKAENEFIGSAAYKKAERLMRKRMSQYLPWFNDNYRLVSHSMSIRALPGSLADRRTCHATRKGNVISVLPGKISGIFKVMDEIRSLL